MRSTRCKMVCDTVTPNETEGTVNVGLYAVTSGSPENERFFKYTPTASFNLNMIRDIEAVKMFEHGKQYYVDIIEAE